jgi:hypothetical protein
MKNYLMKPIKTISVISIKVHCRLQSPWCTQSCFHPQHEFILFKKLDLDVMYIQIIVTIIKMVQVSILEVQLQ